MSPVMVPATDHAPVVRSFSAEDFEVPHGREEEWRFTPLERLRGLHESPEASAETSMTVTGIEAAAVQRMPLDAKLRARVSTPVDRIAAHSWQLADSATVITIPAEAHLSDVVSVQVHTPEGTSFGHLVIDVGAFATMTALITFTGQGVFAGSVDINAGDQSRVTAACVFESERQAVTAARVHVRLGRDANVRSSVITLGGDVTRIHATVEYAAPGGDAELLGLFFADAGQHHEHRVFVDHAQPHCRSSVTYKGALDGVGTHTVWIGDVLVRAGAVGIDTYEVNRNLVLSDGARADSVPNLELETGEVVGAGHASATGRFDDEQLFYLRSRGIPEDLARVLVVRGFFADILGRTNIPELPARIMSIIDDRLGVTDLVGEVIAV